MFRKSGKTALRRVVNFFYEIGASRNRPRAWEQQIGTKMANIAEHTIRVEVLAAHLALLEGGNTARAVFIAAFHDFEEIRTGDQTPFQRPYGAMDGKRAIADMAAATPLEHHILDAFEEYKTRETIEAKCVKDADILDTVFELMELKAQGHRYPTLPEVEAQIAIKRTKYFTDSARALHDAVVAKGAPTPWDWFLSGASTFKDGSYGK